MYAMTKEATLIKYVTDMAAAERHLAQMVRAQENGTPTRAMPQAAPLLARIRSIAESHVIELEAVARTFQGETRSTFKGSITSLTGKAMGTISHFRSHHVAKMLRDDYTVLSLNAIGYEMLHTTGLALGSERVTKVSLEHLRDWVGLIMEISQLVIPVVVAELGETTAVTLTAAKIARMNVLETWRSGAGNPQLQLTEDEHPVRHHFPVAA